MVQESTLYKKTQRLSTSGYRLRSSMTEINDVNKFKHIIVSETVYLKLKGLGGAGDSFNDVLARLLKKLDVRDRSDME